MLGDLQSSVRLVKAVIYHLRSVSQGSRYDKPYSIGPQVAPEVQESSPQSPYTKQADIQGLGILQIHIFKHFKNVKVTSKLQVKIFGVLKQYGDISEPLFDLVQQMTTQYPDRRPDIEKALVYLVWDFLLEQLKRKPAVKDSEQQGIGLKRLRLLSPPVEDALVSNPI